MRIRIGVALIAGVLMTSSGAGALPAPDPPDLPDAFTADVPFQPLQTVYAQDFESDDGGFTVGGAASWEYGTATSPPTPASGQGPAMWGTNLVGDYANNECGYIQSPAIDLSSFPSGVPEASARAARLLFRHWLHVERGFDAGIVLASSDGATWEPLTPVGGYPGAIFASAATCFGLPVTSGAYTTSTVPASDGWLNADLNVSKFLGGPLHLRFVFTSDFSIIKRGWYVDDVFVQLGVGAREAVDLPGYPEEIGVPFTSARTLYAEDFEATSGGWTTEGTDAWEWGTPAEPPVTLPGSLNAWGTRLLGDYLPSECATLTSPAIEIPGASPGTIENVRLDMKVWRHFQNGPDGAVLQVDDGSGWKVMTPRAGYDRTISSSITRTCLGISTAQAAWSGPLTAPEADGWLDTTVDLSRFMGKTIRLRVAFGSDGSTHRRGIYLDEVVVQAGVGASTNIESLSCAEGAGWASGGTNTSWCYGIPPTGPFSAKPVYATNLEGQYSAAECSAIVSPEIRTAAVAGLGALTLTFEHYVDTASSDDGGVIQVSGDGGSTWDTITPNGGYNSSLSTSARGCIDPGSTTMRGYSGNPTGNAYTFNEARIPTSLIGDTIQFRFVFGSGSFTHDFGWYIRTVGLNRGAGNVILLP